ncbi:MAG TPA: AI-2E family transporter [Gemmatimonadaceae bacterium]|nr:AI-2E family transporter [Gemmatimonadaceae bacterium]
MTHKKTPAAPESETPTGEVERLTGHQLRHADDELVRHPRLSALERGLSSTHTRSFELSILCVLAVFYTLYLAREVIVPVVFAVLLKLFFSPITRVLRKAHIPDPVGAALVILVLLSIFGFGGYAISGQAQGWIANAPKAMATAGAKLKKLRQPVERVTRTAEQMESATGVSGEQTPTREVVVRGPSLLSRVFGTTTSLVAGLLEVTVLLFFLLAGGELFLQKLVKVLPNLPDKKRAVTIARETETSISTYLSTILLINACEGTLVAVVMALIGMPNPILWGALAGLLEFIPYLGAATMVVILSVAGLTTFPGLGHALLVPACFLFITIIQANFVSPPLLGRRLTLNPVAIFVGLAVWFFIWGIPGAFMAVPLLAATKIFCDHTEALAPIGEFLGK